MKAQTMNIVKMLSKPTNERMPFEGVQLTKFLQRIPFFKRMFHTQSEQFITLCLSAELKTYDKDENLYDHEDIPEFVYVILEGSVSIESKQTKQDRIIEAFDVIGNVEVVFSMPERAEVVKSLTEITCMVLKAENLMSILKQKEQISKASHFLKINCYFERLSEYDKKSLTLIMKKEHFQKGQTIIYEGEYNKRVFFVIHGKINITKKIILAEKQRQVLLDEVQEMDSHGEYESLNSLKSDVRMIAATTGSCYSINLEEVKEKKNQFLECVRQNAFPYPDTEEVQFRYKIEAAVEKEKKKVVRKINMGKK